MKIATWNVNSLKVRLPQVIEWLKTEDCDILALQETKVENHNYPVEEFEKIGYHCAFNGQKTYNGVTIISRLPIHEVVHDIPGYEDIQKRVITSTINGIRIICAYVVNGESLISDKYLYKLKWLEELTNFVKSNLDSYSKLVLLGDFNIAPSDIDIYDPLAWQGSVLCSAPEREAYQRIIALGLNDSFRMFNNEPRQYTWWNYQKFSFRRKLGLRIDHILISDDLKSKALNCEIDVKPRKNERPSDHAPVILSFF